MNGLPRLVCATLQITARRHMTQRTPMMTMTTSRFGRDAEHAYQLSEGDKVIIVLNSLHMIRTWNSHHVLSIPQVMSLLYYFKNVHL